MTEGESEGDSDLVADSGKFHRTGPERYWQTNTVGTSNHSHSA